jgi:hypothetical protein
VRSRILPTIDVHGKSRTFISKETKVKTILVKAKEAIRALLHVSLAIWFVIIQMLVISLLASRVLTFSSVSFGWLAVTWLSLLWTMALCSPPDGLIGSDCAGSMCRMFWTRRVTVVSKKVTDTDLMEKPIRWLLRIWMILIKRGGRWRAKCPWQPRLSAWRQLAVTLVVLGSSFCFAAGDDFTQAVENGRLANEGFTRCRRYVAGWLAYADPKTGLLPRTINRPGEDVDIWYPKDNAADNYPFMVLTAALTDRTLFEGRMFDILIAETKLTSRIGNLPDDYSFSRQTFQNDQVDISRIIFGSAEYVKDGLLPLTEWLGSSPWSQRMIAILDDIWKQAPVETPYGNIPSTSQEINGEMLQTLSRIYWMTGERKYLDWAIRLGDYYLLDKHHPTRDEDMLRLRDHGCEIVSGLCELYATVSFAMPEKKRAYEKPLHEILDRILEVGLNEHGLFYDWINPRTGEHDKAIADTWGYNLNGFYTVYLIDKTDAYRQAVCRALANLDANYRSYKWEGTSADGYADSIESALNLYNREPISSVAQWLDSEIKVMWNIQKSNGIIEGWQGDGNFARTTVMYCLWKTKGLHIQPWREDIIFGAVQDGNKLKIALIAERDWTGKLIFDAPRHRTLMKLPIDWPRINQLPEWFTVKEDKTYTVCDLTADLRQTFSGEQLHAGIAVILTQGIGKHLLVH